MPINWRQQLCVNSTAVLCMEMQNGVLSPTGPFPQLVAIVEAQQVVSKGAALLAAARARGVDVVHCTAAFRGDRRGTLINTPLVASLLKNKAHMLEGSSAVEVIPEWCSPGDLESRRYHGVSPFMATDLDSQLRAMKIDTVVVMGVSLNLGVTGLCIDAANLGYCVVVVTDAVAGFPADYARYVLTHTLSAVAKLMTSEQIAGYWVSC